jgi:hypothetical protein
LHLEPTRRFPTCTTAGGFRRWPYTWGRVFRAFSLPVDLVYGALVTRTVILGAEKRADLPAPVIFADTHHGFADLPLLRHALARSAEQALER